MKAIVVTDKAAGTAGMTLVERPEPEPAKGASVNAKVRGPRRTATGLFSRTMTAGSGSGGVITAILGQAFPVPTARIDRRELAVLL